MMRRTHHHVPAQCRICVVDAISLVLAALGTNFAAVLQGMTGRACR